MGQRRHGYEKGQKAGTGDYSGLGRGGGQKNTIQIEDGDGETLAFIQLSPDKASEFSDCLAIYAAKLKMAAREKSAPRNTSMRPALLC